MNPEDIISYRPTNYDRIEVTYSDNSVEFLSTGQWAELMRVGQIPHVDYQTSNIAKEYRNCDTYKKNHANTSLYEFQYMGGGRVRSFNRSDNSFGTMTIQQWQDWYGPDGLFKILALCGSQANYNDIGQAYLAEQERERQQAEAVAARVAQAAAQAAAYQPVTIKISKSTGDVIISQGGVEVGRGPINDFYIQYIQYYLIMNDNIAVGINPENPYHLSFEQALQIDQRRIELLTKNRPEERRYGPEDLEGAKALLASHGIVDKKTYRRWMNKNHPDKFPEESITDEQKADIATLSGVVSGARDKLVSEGVAEFLFK